MTAQRRRLINGATVPTTERTLLELHTTCPGKWRAMDLETGQCWRWLEGEWRLDHVLRAWPPRKRPAMTRPVLTLRGELWGFGEDGLTLVHGQERTATERLLTHLDAGVRVRLDKALEAGQRVRITVTIEKPRRRS